MYELQNKPLRILAIDGGGLRGIIPAMILAAIEAEAGRPIHELFDLVAGNATGGLLALALNMPGEGRKPRFTAQQIVDLYRENGRELFPASFWQQIGKADYAFSDRSETGGSADAFHSVFGDIRLSQSLSDLLITSFDLRIRAPYTFRSDRARQNPLFDFPMWQVAQTTCGAASSLDPEVVSKLTSDELFAVVDRAVYATNSTMAAFTEARQQFPTRDVVMVSLGTGFSAKSVEYREARQMGGLGWIRPLLDIMSYGVNKTTEFALRQLLRNENGPQRYYRLQVEFGSGCDPDWDEFDAGSFTRLKELTANLLDEHGEELHGLVARIAGEPVIPFPAVA